MPNATPTERRSPCPIACTLDILGDRWTLLVIRDLVLGRTQFKEFRQSPERIATNILTDRLNRLTEAGLVERVLPEDGGKRATYHLTQSGESLKPLLAAVRDWGLAHIPETEVLMKRK